MKEMDQVKVVASKYYEKEIMSSLYYDRQFVLILSVHL
jgi:hypothetical protein